MSGASTGVASGSPRPNRATPAVLWNGLELLRAGYSLMPGVEGRLMPKGARMEDELTRAQHYRALAAQMRETAAKETDEARGGELLDLAGQYDRLADNLVGKHR